MSKRYTMNFEQDIREKLSSTIFQPRETVSLIEDSDKSSNANDGSSLEIIEHKEETINISSSSENDKENVPTPVTSKKTKNLLQPKITAAVAKKSDDIKYQYVSRKFYEKELKKLEELKNALQTSERLLGMSNVLPDGGRQMRLRVESTRNEIAIKSKYISTLKLEEEAEGFPSSINSTRSSINKSFESKPKGKLEIASPPYDPENKPKNAFFNNKAPNWDDLAAAVNQIVPTHTGKQGMATFENQKALTVDRLKVKLTSS